MTECTEKTSDSAPGVDCEDYKEKTSLIEADIDEVIATEEYYTVGKKTTVCVLTLVNGFEVVGTSSCVCAKNYNQDLGAPIARKKAIDQIWMLEGYLLQQNLMLQEVLSGEDNFCDSAETSKEEASELPPIAG